VEVVSSWQDERELSDAWETLASIDVLGVDAQRVLAVDHPRAVATRSHLDPKVWSQMWAESLELAADTRPPVLSTRRPVFDELLRHRLDRRRVAEVAAALDAGLVLGARPLWVWVSVNADLFDAAAWSALVAALRRVKVSLTAGEPESLVSSPLTPPEVVRDLLATLKTHDRIRFVFDHPRSVTDDVAAVLAAPIRQVGPGTAAMLALLSRWRPELVAGVGAGLLHPGSVRESEQVAVSVWGLCALRVWDTAPELYPELLDLASCADRWGPLQSWAVRQAPALSDPTAPAELVAELVERLGQGDPWSRRPVRPASWPAAVRVMVEASSIPWPAIISMLDGPEVAATLDVLAGELGPCWGEVWAVHTALRAGEPVGISNGGLDPLELVAPTGLRSSPVDVFDWSPGLVEVCGGDPTRWAFVAELVDTADGFADAAAQLELAYA
jgi:hypothetical protein